MGVDAPLGHVVEDGVGVVDDDFEADGFEDAELVVRDEAADLEDAVGVGIKASHLLCVYPVVELAILH